MAVKNATATPDRFTNSEPAGRKLDPRTTTVEEQNYKRPIAVLQIPENCVSCICVPFISLTIYACRLEEKGTFTEIVEQCAATAPFKSSSIDTGVARIDYGKRQN